MPKKKAAAAKEPELHATSLKMPKELWKATHFRALEEGRDFREVVWTALEMYLKANTRRKNLNHE